MNHNPIKLPKYSPKKFVNRRQEIDLVMKQVHALLQRERPDTRTIIFTGERGTGKSWLLAHLRKKELGALSGLLTFEFNLQEYDDWGPILAVADILRRLDDAIGKRNSELGITLADKSRNLMQDVRQSLEKHVLVLLVDHVYESDWKLLAALEDYVLGPLAVEPRTLIVMAGRGRAYPWKTPELRLKARFKKLEPFSEEQFTKKQLEKQQKKALSRAEKIHQISGGNPLANYLLATYEDTATALDKVIDGMLETVPDEQRHRVRDYLEALCVLRSFDEERIPTMLAAYYKDDTYRNWPYAQSRRVRETLVKWAFARWDADKGGYVLDELTRKLLERYLETAQPDRWERLQRAASQLYEEWAHDYPRTRARWQREVQYHAQYLPTPPHGQLPAAAPLS